jgi:HSP20 family protein
MATVVRWDPIAQIERLHRELDRMFVRLEPGAGAPRMVEAWLPEADVEQTEDATVYRFDLPGVPTEQLRVSADGGRLTISGERREQHEEKHEGYLSRERVFGRFERSMRLPENSKNEDIKASFKDGVLAVKVPRDAESQSHQVTITTS